MKIEYLPYLSIYIYLHSNVSGINPGDRNPIEENYVCFALALSARDKALIISTNEVQLSKSCDWQPDFTTDHGARIWFPGIHSYRNLFTDFCVFAFCFT